MVYHHLLVVDDDPIANRVLCETLHMLTDARVDAAHNAEQAISATKSNRYDLIFMDLYMPGMNGLACAERIREQARYRTVPMIGLSANDIMDEERELLEESGIHSFYVKPLEQETLEQILRQYEMCKALTA